MKKITALILIFALLLTLSGCGFTLFRETYKKQTGETLPKGHIEEKTFYYPEKTTTTLPDGTSSGTKLIYKDAVDKDRLVIKQCIGIIYYENDVETGREDYTLDENGNPITITSSQGTLTTYTYVYDEQDRITEKTCALDGNPDHTITYTYDENGNVLTEDYQGSYTQRTENIYDDQGRVTETIVSLNVEPISHTVTEYAENGRKSRVTDYDGAGSIIGLQEYAQDGDYETVWLYHGDGTPVARWEHTYSYSGDLARRIVYSPEGELVSTTLYTHIGIRNEYLVYD